MPSKVSGTGTSEVLEPCPSCVTETVSVFFSLPLLADIVMLVLRAAPTLGSTETEIDPFPLPEFGVTFTHAPVALAVQAPSVPIVTSFIAASSASKLISPERQRSLHGLLPATHQSRHRK